MNHLVRQVFIIRGGVGWGSLSVLCVRVHRRWPIRAVRWHQPHLVLLACFTGVVHPLQINVLSSSFVCWSSPPPFLLCMPWVSSWTLTWVNIYRKGVVYSIHEVRSMSGISTRKHSAPWRAPLLLINMSYICFIGKNLCTTTFSLSSDTCSEGKTLQNSITKTFKCFF